MKKRGEYYITQFFYLNLQTLIFIEKKMKQLKFLVVALTLLMGISFTSCLNSDSDPYNYGGGMVKVQNYMGVYSFKGENGVTITPTSASISALEANGFKMSDMSDKVAQIYYRWDPTQVDIPADEKDVKGVELYSIESLDNTVEIVEQKGVAANDSISKSNNAAIISLGYDAGGIKYAPKFFYDDHTLLLPINYYITNKRHFLTLVYYPNEDNGTTLRLYFLAILPSNISVRLATIKSTSAIHLFAVPPTSVNIKKTKNGTIITRNTVNLFGKFILHQLSYQIII